jgi:hypothetical protein
VSLNSSLEKILLKSQWDEVKSQWNELKSERAEVGIGILILVAIFWGMLLLSLIGWLQLLVSTSRFTGGWAFLSPSVLGVFVGMAVYLSDRKGFLIRRSRNELIAALLAILGFFLICEGLSEGLLFLSLMGLGGGPTSWEGWIVCAFFLTFDGLVVLSGILLMSDLDRIVEDKHPYAPSAERLDVETQTKYPSDLFARYVEQYPHNPEGVLEWHIHKKMKEGKTREQAIKELMHALLH